MLEMNRSDQARQASIPWPSPLPLPTSPHRAAFPSFRSETARRDVVIVANRLPVTLRAGRIQRSPGGLVSALSSSVAEGSHWIGWAGATSTKFNAAALETTTVDGINMHSVELSEDDLASYYDGFCNSVLWPLFHGRLQQPNFDTSWWDAYVAVNERFTSATAERSPLGGIVWIHDYHLLLAPQMIRAARPDLRIGIFLHIPFPSAQIFDILPWRVPIIRGMMGADLVGFQTTPDAENFRSAVRRHSGLGTGHNGRYPTIGAFPISVDFEHWNALGDAAATEAIEKRQTLNAEHVLLGVDRLDYTKGIAKRIEAFGELLDEGQLNADDCVLVQVAVPSRVSVDAYCCERREVEELVAAVNARHQRSDGTDVVQYLHESFDVTDLAVWYRTADVMLVTPLADGMNLVAKEFVAARGDLGGSLVLSEFAGAAHELTEGAEIVNPYDLNAVKNAVMRALTAPASVRKNKMAGMRSVVEHNDVAHWAARFLDQLDHPLVRQGTPTHRRSASAHLHRADTDVSSMR